MSDFSPGVLLSVVDAHTDGGFAAMPPIFAMMPLAYTAPFRDNYFGLYKIEGITQNNGVGHASRVLLAPHEAPSLIIREAYTDATGVFSFTYLKAGRYMAWKMSNDGVIDIVAHEYIAAVAM